MDGAAPEPGARPSEHDPWLRALGYLLLGVVIPRFAFIFDKVTWRDTDYWIGNGWFLVAAVAIFEANRWIANRLRAHLDWLVHPFWKVVIKHNRHTEAEPLAIDVRLEADGLVVSHPLRPKAGTRPGTGTGLANLRERLALLGAGQLEVEQTATTFQVRIPLAS